MADAHPARELAVEVDGRYEGRTGVGIYKNLNEAGTRPRIIIG